MELVNNNQVPEGYKKTEVGVIPEDWEVIELKECCSKITDGTHDTPKSVSSGIPYLTAIHIQKNYIDHENCYFLPPSVHSQIYKRCNPEKNDVLMVNIGAGVGNTALVDVNYEFSLKNVALLKPCVDKIIGSYLNQNQIFNRDTIVASLLSGGAQPFLSLKQIGKIKISLPPLPEQKAIAQTLSNVDALIDALDKLIAKKRNIKTATMQQLLTGKTRLPGFGEGKGYKKSALGLIPEDWNLRRLGEDALTYSGGTPYTQNPNYYSGEIPWITSGDLNKRYIFNVKGKISEDGLRNSSAKMIFPNTLLLALYGATAGISAISKIEAAINQAILAIIPQTFDCEYLFYYLETNKNKIIETYIQGGQPNLSGKIINSLLVPYPKPEEQKAIAQVLSDIDTEITALEKRRAKTQAIKQGMMQELLTGKTRLINN